ncbi:MAG: hypothetical protein M3Z32_01385 [Acidobacteriota bacterium]|nr:hypothetical protein [Acidobacteriota bacterium]
MGFPDKMSAQPDLTKLSVGQFAERFRTEMIPLGSTFSYFCASVPLSEEDLKEYLEEPIAALPPAVSAVMPKISLMLVPYLERVSGKERGKHTDPNQGEFVCTEKPSAGRLFWASQLRLDGEEILLFALQDQEVAEYHYRFYRMLATLMADRWSEEQQAAFSGLIREELAAGIHGEVDEESWHVKQALLRRQSNVRKETKIFRAYTRQSFIDTLTLYLHGICCDIDVETGPRQLPSRYMRKRLSLLHSLYPPPSGYALFPEQVKPH